MEGLHPAGECRASVSHTAELSLDQDRQGRGARWAIHSQGLPALPWHGLRGSSSLRTAHE